LQSSSTETSYEPRAPNVADDEPPRVDRWIDGVRIRRCDRSSQSLTQPNLRLDDRVLLCSDDAVEGLRSPVRVVRPPGEGSKLVVVAHSSGAQQALAFGRLGHGPIIAVATPT
jgi:hypothetical protein